jgi:phage terminase large subunit-like protein
MSWPPRYLTPVDPKHIANGDGDLAIEFAETFGSIGKDGIAGRRGQTLQFREWQKELTRAVYARDENGDLNFQVLLVGEPRKNGKSAWASAAIAIFKLFGEDVNGAEIVIAAAEKEQARIIFEECKRMVQDTELNDLCNIFKDSIFVPSSGNVLKVVSAEAYSKEGYNPSCVIIDELHAHKDRALFDVFSLAMGNRGKLGQL